VFTFIIIFAVHLHKLVRMLEHCYFFCEYEKIMFFISLVIKSVEIA